MSDEIRNLLASILEHQAEINHDIEMLQESNPEVDEALREIRRRQNEIIADVETIARSVQMDDLTDIDS